MLTIEQTKKILGETAQGLSDEQLTEIRDSYYNLVNVIFDKYVDDLKNGKINEKGQTVSSPEKPLPSFPSKKPRHRKQ